MRIYKASCNHSFAQIGGNFHQCCGRNHHTLLLYLVARSNLLDYTPTVLIDRQTFCVMLYVSYSLFEKDRSYGRIKISLKFHIKSSGTTLHHTLLSI